MQGSTMVAVAVVAAATVGGAVLAGAFRNARGTALRLAAAALLAVVAFDLVPDVVRDVAETGSARWLVGAASLAGFAAAGVAARWVCACGTHPTTTTGLALAVHRALEGAALALVGSAGVIVALVVHAAGEGFALQSYGARGTRHVRPLLVLACVSPAVGATGFGGAELPAGVAPIVTAVIAGTLLAATARMITAAEDTVPLMEPHQP